MSNERRLNLGIGFDPADQAGVLGFLDTLDHKGNLSALNLKTGYMAVSQAVRDIAAVGEPVLRFFEESAKMAMEDQRSIVARNAALRDAGAYSTQYAAALDAQAASFQRGIGISDSYTRSIQTQLLALEVNADIVDESTQATLQLAKVLDTGAVSAAKLFAKFVNDGTDSIRGTTIAVRDHATEQERLQKVLDATSAGWGILNEEATTTEGQLKILNEQWGELRETLGSEIGESPDMATAIGAIATAVADLNESLKETGGLGGAAAEGLLTFAATVARAMGRIQMAADWLGQTPTGIGPGKIFGWQALPDDYSNAFLNAESSLMSALEEMQAKNQRYQQLPPELKNVFDYMETVKQENRQNRGGGGLRIPGVDPPNGTPKALPYFSEYMGFRPHDTELGALWREIPRTSPLGMAGNVAEMQGGFHPPDLSAGTTGTGGIGFEVPDLSGGSTGSRRLPWSWYWRNNRSEALNMGYRNIRGQFDDGALSSLAGTALNGGDIFSAAGGIAGAGFGPWGSLIGSTVGGFVEGGVNKLKRFFGIGGGHKVERGDSASYPVFTRDDGLRAEVRELANAFYAQTISLGARGLDARTNQIQAQSGRV